MRGVWACGFHNWEAQIWLASIGADWIFKMVISIALVAELLKHSRALDCNVHCRGTALSDVSTDFRKLAQVLLHPCNQLGNARNE